MDDSACRTATAKAILVVCEGEEVWIPTSQIHEDSEVYKPGTEGILVIPQWVAEMKELPCRETRLVRRQPSAAQVGNPRAIRRGSDALGAARV